MELVLQRIKDNRISTTGELTVDDLRFVTIEDPHQDIKIPGKTRIPAGIYEIKLLNKGNKDAQYTRLFPSFHVGMLWLQDVPNFKGILIHIGNQASESRGCVLTGTKILNDNFITGSKVAYISLYKHVSKALLEGEQVFINIIDETQHV